ncbi:MAG: hypothetical protein A3F84_25280 [Candidatus Handelsmanbacteria bacterium RIFCSPLOWO2_12_FULL_64_10]|uniref:PorV/PorQ family protein n=1 Tax=Handelsmanbacteria sp. (strain RIFCSPLOWO2_12_FULL_64_10) TaxID=1817868 RepID=A0A1F6CVF4_HANXR|nr:MAG: hypothetical protein A3F84_25280 [Candidatus Handelsmanbacteria bacterium RIFCSPLOWO2_12_FULL_64_10]
MKRNLLTTVLALALGLLLAASSAFAGIEWTGASGIVGTKKVNLSGLQFLKIGQSARAAGMGDAFTAVADDINAMYYNGAGLSHVKRLAYGVNYTQWLAGTELYSLAVAWNTGSARSEVIGLSILTQKTEDMEETTIFMPGGTGQKIQVSQMAVGAVYVVKFTDKFSFSSKINYIQQKLYTQTASTFSFDIGSYFYTGFRSMRVAMSFKNFGPDKKVKDYAFNMPLYYNMGIAGEVFGEKGKPFYVTLDIESAFAIDYEQRYLFGAEAWVKDRLALRAGYKHNFDLEQYTVGVGVKQPFKGNRAVTVDVAYSPLKEKGGVKLFDPVLRLSLGGTF